MNKNKKHMKFIQWIMISIFLACVLTGCKKLTLTSSENNRFDDGVSAVEDAMKNKKSNNETTENSKETRKPDVTKIQALYLWEKGNVPAVTEFTKDMTGYFDSWDFRPYTQEEGALDVAGAVRFIRKNAKSYQIDPNNIAVMGFSAGGIQRVFSKNQN